MFSLTIEYAMRAMVALAAGDGRSMTTRQIADTMKVPQSYLSKVLQSLVRAGLVHSTRGLKGGFVLARKPADLNMMEILNAVGPYKRIKTCPLDMDEHSSDLCPLHRRLDQAMGMVQEAFEGTTLAEILSDENHCPTLQTQLAKLEARKTD
ncbi:MAG: Rrf2 family transcriptional regulator [Candidatus Krumholzibacteria bacterium]|nr:Rrf2 family transcriptional regulator [Candidatus Krumholzibacteria bacterium]